MHIKDEVLAKGSFDIKDGSKTRFWDDTWVGDLSFKVKYPSLYNIVRDPHATVTRVMATSPLNVPFRGLWWITNLWNGIIWWHRLLMLKWWRVQILLDGT